MSKTVADAIGRTSVRVIKAMAKLAEAGEELAGVCEDLQSAAAACPPESPDRDAINVWACTALRSQVAVNNALEFIKRGDWLYHLPSRTVGGEELFDRSTASRRPA